MVLLVFTVSVAFALRFSQQLALKQAKTDLVYAREKVEVFKEKEGQFILLKQRLTEIQKLTEGDEKKRSILNLLLSLVPPGVQLSELILDNRGEVIMSIESSSLITLNQFIADLSNPEKNLNAISRVDLDNLALIKGNTYTLSLRVTSR